MHKADFDKRSEKERDKKDRQKMVIFATMQRELGIIHVLKRTIRFPSAPQKDDNARNKHPKSKLI